MDRTLNYSHSYIINKSGHIESVPASGIYPVMPAINIDSSVLVTDEVEGGYYRFVFNDPPVIQNIPNLKGNYGSATEIVYTATDSDNTDLMHYISFDNGSSWTEINPIRRGDIYYYSHVFNELNTYYCRIKVEDGAENYAISNGFSAASATLMGVGMAFGMIGNAFEEAGLEGAAEVFNTMAQYATTAGAVLGIIPPILSLI